VARAVEGKDASGAHRQRTAIVALVLLGATIVLAAVVAGQAFPRGVTVLACGLVGVACVWWGLVRRGVQRVLGLLAAVLLLIGAVVLVAVEGHVLEDALIIAALLLGLAATQRAFATRAHLPTTARPAHPVLFYNPKSGGGKAERFDVAGQAHARGITPVELHLGDDLACIVRQAITDGADALGMAGGDGSQAVVAAIAAQHGLPYVCVPAGTRNHFALDLGVDRDDVVGALDAFVNGGERVVDLAEVNARVFVNNVSLGVYAEAVQRSSYRDAKLRTLADTLPTVLGPESTGSELSWVGPDGQSHKTSAVVLVSNDPYRLGRAVGSGTRPRLDAGRLGIAVIGSHDRRGDHRRVQEWATVTFDVDSEGQVAAGIDGEAVMLDPPLHFRTRPKALRVLIAPQHPGTSPSALMPAGPWEAIRAIARVATSGVL
jgi:diacylglycerol kinase family enzyme